MRLQQLETSLQTQSQEQTKKVEEMHKQQKKVGEGLVLDMVKPPMNRLPSNKKMCPLKRGVCL